jgi:cell division protein ZipA
MQLPGPIDNTVAFEWFCRAGNELAQKLDGVLCDESRNTMTPQGLNHMKDQVSSFNLKLQLSQQPSIH